MDSAHIQMENAKHMWDANDGHLTKKKGRASLYCSTDFDNKDFEKADM